MSYKGKAIYQPKGKAAEYSEWACNFYVGCVAMTANGLQVALVATLTDKLE